MERSTVGTNSLTAARAYSIVRSLVPEAVDELPNDLNLHI